MHSKHAWLNYYLLGTVLGPGGHSHEQEKGIPCSQEAHSPGEMNRPLKNFVIVSSTEDCESKQKGNYPRLRSEKAAGGWTSKQSYRRDHESACRVCVCVCALVHMSMHMHASGWVTRVWQYTRTALQAEGVVCAKVGGERKHLLCWFYNTETFTVVEIPRKE